MRFRSITTLCVFGIATVVALKYPLVGLGMCICCLIVYLKPEAPGAAKVRRSGSTAAMSPLSSDFGKWHIADVRTVPSDVQLRA
jgi:hypothetical protein